MPPAAPGKCVGTMERHGEEVLHALRVDTFDVNGDGYMDSVKLPGQTGTVAEIALADAGDGPTDTLQAIWTNPTNDTQVPHSVTALSYSVSTRFNSTVALDPAVLASTTPRLPFPVWVVSAIVSQDGLGRTITSQLFGYQGGYFDASRREFRGFRDGLRIDDDHGVTEWTKFHQAEPFQGREASRTTYTIDLAQPPRQTNLQWRAVATGGRTVVELASRAVTQQDDTARTVTSTYTYDTCGNTTRETVTEAGSTLTENGANFQLANCNQYRVCTGICDRVSKTFVVGGLTKDYSYFPNGNLNTVTGSGENNPVTTMTYDSYGNLHTVTNPRGTVTRYDYDTDQLHVATKVEDDGPGGAKLTSTFEYDARFGTEKKRSGPACGATEMKYDEFGRLWGDRAGPE